MVAQAPLTTPKILITSKVEYAYMTRGPGQIFPRGIFSVVVVVEIMVVVVGLDLW